MNDLESEICSADLKIQSERDIFTEELTSDIKNIMMKSTNMKSDYRDLKMSSVEGL